MNTLRTLAATSLLLVPRAAEAQVLNLRLVQPDSSTPIVGAFVVVSDDSGHPVASGASDGAGELTLRSPAAGPYQLQVQRVGYTPGEMRGELSEGQRLSLVLTPTGARVLAPAIDPAAEFACGAAAMADPALAVVWPQARTGLSLTAMSTFDHLYYLQAWVTNQRWNPPELPPVPPALSRMYSNPWPIWVPTAKEWTADGFIENRQSFATPPLWHGPDPGFFLADAFLEGYCLRLVAPGPTPVLSWMDAPSADWIGIEYRAAQPSSASGSTVQGVLWLDRGTFEPRRVEWTYTDLPDWAKGHDAGGRVDLATVPAGGWFAQRWSWRIPQSRPQPFGLFLGYWEYAGEVYQVQDPSRVVVARFGE